MSTDTMYFYTFQIRNDTIYIVTTLIDIVGDLITVLNLCYTATDQIRPILCSKMENEDCSQRRSLK